MFQSRILEGCCFCQGEVEATETVSPQQQAVKQNGAVEPTLYTAMLLTESCTRATQVVSVDGNVVLLPRMMGRGSLCGSPPRLPTCRYSTMILYDVANPQQLVPTRVYTHYPGTDYSCTLPGTRVLYQYHVLLYIPFNYLTLTSLCA